MNVTCPSCHTIYRVDPKKVPAAGVLAQCARCPQLFEVVVSGNDTPLTPHAPVDPEAQRRFDSIDGGAALDPEIASPRHQELSQNQEAPAPELGGTAALEDEALPSTGASVQPDSESRTPEAADTNTWSRATDSEFMADPGDVTPAAPPVVAAMSGEGRSAEPEAALTTFASPAAPAESAQLGAPGAHSAEEPILAEEAEAAAAVSLPPPPFGSSDPHQRARRLARALISDIVVYHPDRRTRGLRQGTLRQEFRDEIRKSWEEYESQVGNQLARETSYFRDALNEILADGTQLF